MLCTHKTTIFCQFGNLEICPNFANPYLTQFSSISGGNCITELDTSEILEGERAAKYLTMVGQLQWLVALGRFDIHAQVAPCQGSELPLDKDIWTDSKGFTPMPLGPRIMQSGLGLNNLTIPSFLIKILTGHTLYMVMSMRSFLMTCQNHLARSTTTMDSLDPQNT